MFWGPIFALAAVLATSFLRLAVRSILVVEGLSVFASEEKSIRRSMIRPTFVYLLES